MVVCESRYVETAFFIKFLTDSGITLEQEDLPDNAPWVISTFVKAELRRTLIQRAIYLYERFCEYNNLSDILRRVSRLRFYRRRYHDTIQDIIILLHRKIEEENQPFSPSDCYDFMKDFLWRLIIHFIAIKDSYETIDETGCIIGKEDPKYDELKEEFDNTLSEHFCSRVDPKCKIKEFFEKNAVELSKIVEILNGIDGLKIQDRLMAQNIEGILSDLDILPSRRHCWNSGGAILVCEAPISSKILHYDEVFCALAPGLGKEELFVSVSGKG